MLALPLPYTQQTISILRFHCGRQILRPPGVFRHLWPVASPCALWPALMPCGQPLWPVASPCALWPPTTQTHPFHPPHPPPALSPHPIPHPPVFQFFTSFRPFQLLSPFLCHFGYLGGHFLPLEPLTYPFYTLRSYPFYIPLYYHFLQGGDTFRAL
jgi:hypothetical protein